MRSDLLSKRVFYAGCFGLPWLWTVHVLYHWKNASSFSENVVDDEALLNPDDRTCHCVNKMLHAHFIFYDSSP
jgi:Presenilin enhancer-2 subunit of gamma secretase